MLCGGLCMAAFNAGAGNSAGGGKQLLLLIAHLLQDIGQLGAVLHTGRLLRLGKLHQCLEQLMCGFFLLGACCLMYLLQEARLAGFIFDETISFLVVKLLLFFDIIEEKKVRGTLL